MTRWGALAAALVGLWRAGTHQTANWWGEPGLFLGFKELLMHLICDRKLSLAGMYQQQKKALEGEAQEEKPESNRE